MTITRSYACPKGGRTPLVQHGYVDDGVAGGKIVLTAKQVVKGGTPTKSGIVNSSQSRWLSVSIKNRSGSLVTWAAAPTIRTTNEYNVDDPVYDSGCAILAGTQDGTFAATLAAGAEQIVRVDSRFTGWGIIVQADAPGQTLDLLTSIVSTVLIY